MKTLYLLDISSFIFRAFFAIRSLSSPKGEPTNAVYGVAAMVQKFLQEAKPEYLVVAYDSKEPSFRKQLYADYKANRSAPPEDLIPQFARIDQLVAEMKIPSFRRAGVEADDLIASLALQWCAQGQDYQAIIVTGDKDLMQLVGPQILVWDTLAAKKYTAQDVEAKFGVSPVLIRDYLALVGDSSDNIPGVSGIGPKSAVQLLSQFGSLEGVLDASKKGLIQGKKGETLQAEAKEAVLSQVLATLKSDIDLEWSTEKLAYAFHFGPELEALFSELGFYTLIKNWKALSGVSEERLGIQASQAPSDLPPPPEVRVSVTNPQFVTVSDLAELKELTILLLKKGEFAIDLETTSLNPRLAKLVGISLCCDLDRAYYIPVGHVSEAPLKQLSQSQVFEVLAPLIEDSRIKKVGQNLKYDWSVLRALGLKPQGLAADSMVADYLLEPEGRHGLDLLAKKYFNYSMLSFEEVCSITAQSLIAADTTIAQESNAKALKNLKAVSESVGFEKVSIELATRYSAEDAWMAYRLWRTIEPKLHENHLMRIFAEVDMPLIPVLIAMEERGIQIDVNYLKTLSEEFSKDLLKIEKVIRQYGEPFQKADINLNSPKQLSQLLFEDLKLPVQSKTKTGYSTDASVLEALAPMHEVPRLLLEYRDITKLIGTYVEPLPLLCDPITGRVHSSFHQTVAATGRLSSSDPNLQNIPVRSERGLRIRRAFIAGEGSVLLSADYSQIELRLLAHMSGDADLVGSFNRGEDVHKRTASDIYQVAPEQVTDTMRSVAKAINFGLMYGKTPFGLSQELGISRKEAAEMIDKYFVRYSGVKKFLDQQINDAREQGYSVTLLGRKRPLPDIRSKNHAIRTNAERMAMNAPIQGTAADLVKVAMIALFEGLNERKLRTQLLVQVHDEILLEVPMAELTEVQNLTREILEQVPHKMLALSVPLTVNMSHGQNWMDL